MHAFDLSLATFGIILELHVALSAHVLGSYFHMILAPVRLAQLQHGEISIRCEVVTVVEDGDLARFLVDRTHCSICVILNEVALESNRGISKNLQAFPEVESEWTWDKL